MLGGGHYTKVKGLAMIRARSLAVVSTPPANTTWRVYYYAGGKPIAMREMPAGNSTGTLYYLHSDHLGSTSVTTCGSTACGTVGSVFARQRYYPYGEIRPGGTGTQPTTVGFTGQRREDAGLGSLMFFQARYFSPALGRFLSADSIVPSAGNPQALNRFSYSYNSPLNYIDLSGHTASCTTQECDEGRWSIGSLDWLKYLARYGVKLLGNWSARNVLLAVVAVGNVGHKLGSVAGGTAAEAFSAAYNTSSDNPLTLFWGNADAEGINLSDECTGIGGGGCTTSSHLINFMSLSEPGGNRTAAMANLSARNNIVHELGHAFALRLGSNSGGPYDVVGAGVNAWQLGDKGYYQYPLPESASLTWRQHPSTMASAAPGHEAFADMFLGWTFNRWANDTEQIGPARSEFMTTNMAEWVSVAAGR